MRSPLPPPAPFRVQFSGSERIEELHNGVISEGTREIEAGHIVGVHLPNDLQEVFLQLVWQDPMKGHSTGWPVLEGTGQGPKVL